jgi:urease accessory protein
MSPTTSMSRALSVSARGAWSGTPADTVVLDYDHRHRRHGALKGTAGVEFVLDLSDATPLRDGDGLHLEDGRIVAVAAAPEALAEIRAAGAAELMRAAWHLGSRHLPAELRPDRILIRRDPVVEEMVAGLGAMVSHVEAPFDPEGATVHPDPTQRHENVHEHDDRP